MDVIRKMDMYPKLKAEDQIRTAHGACLSFVALIIMSYLFMSEYLFYRTIDVKDRLMVNSSHGERLKAHTEKEKTFLLLKYLDLTIILAQF